MSLLEAGYAPAPAPKKIVSAILFNIGWLAIVVAQSSLFSPIILIFLLAIHFALIGSIKREWKVLCSISLFGIVIDQALFGVGILTLAGQLAVAPLWLSCLWPLLATTLLYAFHGLRLRPFLALVLGSVGGVLSYVAGTRLTEIEFASLFWGPVIIAVLWAAIFPILLQVPAWLNSEEASYR